MRNAIEEDDPAILRATLPVPRESDVNDFVVTEARVAGADDLHGAGSGIDREDAALRARRIFESGKGEEQNRADGDPGQVSPRRETSNHLAMIRVVTRDEIQQKLIAIVREEKNVAEDLLQAETPLADAGIDSLDSLTILFAIEEQFRISIPDERARAMKTFGDMVDIVQELLPAQ